MGSRERPVDRGLRTGRAALARIGVELRASRTDRGLSVDAVAAALGISNAEVSRIERALSPKAPLVTIARFAAVVGLDLVTRLYPGGRPLRDRAQISLLSDLNAIVHPSLRWDAEVPLPMVGDQRAWDAMVRGSGWRFGVEAETAPRDGQALVRRLQLKERDGAVDGVLLAVRDTRTVRLFLEEAAGILRPMFPITSREALAKLRAGMAPTGNAIVIVPRRSERRSGS